MIEQSTETVSCSKCGAEFEADILTGIDVALYPELKDFFMQGMVNMFQCPECESFFYYEPTLFAYQDIKEGFLGIVFPLSYEKDADRHIKKFREGITAALNEEGKEYLEPVFLFGYQSLKDFLEFEDKMEIEAEIAEHICKSLGLDSFKIELPFARKHGVQRVIPIQRGLDPNTIYPATLEVYNHNQQLNSYLSLAKAISINKDLPAMLLKVKVRGRH
ncbi:MAG: CpXC domain-containing protein [Elusimicrobiota bacterium]|jgi:hypothetical protein|nr:CpXC domain-containing protein [Elusimicrobiota bacterium]